MLRLVLGTCVFTHVCLLDPHLYIWLERGYLWMQKDPPLVIPILQILYLLVTESNAFPKDGFCVTGDPQLHCPHPEYDKQLNGYRCVP